jgi:hypothetical protein
MTPKPDEVRLFVNHALQAKSAEVICIDHAKIQPSP